MGNGGWNCIEITVELIASAVVIIGGEDGAKRHNVMDIHFLAKSTVELVIIRTPSGNKN